MVCRSSSGALVWVSFRQALLHFCGKHASCLFAPCGASESRIPRSGAQRCCLLSGVTVSFLGIWGRRSIWNTAFWISFEMNAAHGHSLLRHVAEILRESSSNDSAEVFKATTLNMAAASSLNFNSIAMLSLSGSPPTLFSASRTDCGGTISLGRKLPVEVS